MPRLSPLDFAVRYTAVLILAVIVVVFGLVAPAFLSPASLVATLKAASFIGIAAVGMTDQQAREAGLRCECRVLPLEYVPRALVNRDTRGFVKIVAEAETGRVVGITAVAKDAGELAAAGVYMLSASMTVDQVATLWCPYLTMAEGLKIAAQSFRTDVSKLSCCAA